jgi:hypothetical protein
MLLHFHQALCRSTVLPIQNRSPPPSTIHNQCSYGWTEHLCDNWSTSIYLVEKPGRYGGEMSLLNRIESIESSSVSAVLSSVSAVLSSVSAVLSSVSAVLSSVSAVPSSVSAVFSSVSAVPEEGHHPTSTSAAEVES